MFCLSLLFPASLPASDYLYEKQLSDAIAGSLDQGELVWLQSQRPFLAVYQKSESTDVRGVALIVPGIMGHADSEGLVRTLRKGFAARGFNAMSLQMPVRRPGQDLKSHVSLIEGSGARIEAALGYLVSPKIRKVILIAHGLGAWMAVDYLKDRKKTPVSGLALIAMPLFGESESKAPALEGLENIRVPVLDIFGSRDLPLVTDAADLRRLRIQQNAPFRQIEIAGAGHEFANDTDLLFKRVYSWAMRLASEADP